jgi:hypothetical protein
VPAAVAVTKGKMRGENRAAAVETAPGVLDVHVMDLRRELARERGGVEELTDEVTRVEVHPDAFRPAERVRRSTGRHEVVGDLRRMHLQAESDARLLEDVEQRLHALRDPLVTPVDLLEVVGRERVKQRPERRTEEAVHLFDAEGGGGSSSVLETPGGAAPYALRIAVSPDLERQDLPVTLVDRITDRFADQMSTVRPAPEPVALEQRTLPPGVRRIAERCRHVEVVAPAGGLEPVVPSDGASRSELVERQIRPLPRKACERPRHRWDTWRSAGFTW